MKFAIGILALSIGFVGMNAQAASPGTAGELGLHKIERLISLKKISPTFSTQTLSLAVSAASSGFNVMAMQGMASDGSMRMLAMTADKDGKALTYKESGTKDPAAPLAFPSKSALTFLELGMHCIGGELIGGSDKCKTFANTKMYNDHFKSAALSETKDSAGKVTGAEVAIKGDGLAKTFVVVLANDGTLVSVAEK